MIPAFAVGRTQDILYVMSEFCRSGRVCPPRVYVDSPMALAATRITLDHPELYDRETARLSAWMQDGQGKTEIRFTEDVEDSKRINAIRSGAVILSASGMCEGGRIKYHLKYNLPRLTDQDAGLSRLVGHIGGRGPGEASGRRGAFCERPICEEASRVTWQHSRCGCYTTLGGRRVGVTGRPWPLLEG